WGAAPLPRLMVLNEPSRGSNIPSIPRPWPVNPIQPSGAGATSCKPMPAAIGKYLVRNGLSCPNTVRETKGAARMAADVDARNRRRFIALSLREGSAATPDVNEHSPAPRLRQVRRAEQAF